MIRRSILIATFISLTSLLVLGFTLSRPANNATLSAAKFSVTVTFVLGKRTQNGTCGPGRGICDIKIGVGTASPFKVAGVASPLDDQKLECVFQGQLPDKDSTFVVDRDVAVAPAIAQKLGFKSLTILSGEYAVTPGKGKFGAVELNIKTTK